MIMKPFSNLKQASFDEDVLGRIESGGPGKNVLLRNNNASAEKVTDVNLEILDYAEPDSSDEEEYDPYNSGRFDMSKMWRSRSHK